MAIPVHCSCGKTLQVPESAAGAGQPVPGLDAGRERVVQWHGHSYPGKVLKKENERWFIHYVGWPSNWDEWVGRKGIRYKK